MGVARCAAPSLCRTAGSEPVGTGLTVAPVLSATQISVTPSQRSCALDHDTERKYQSSNLLGRRYSIRESQQQDDGLAVLQGVSSAVQEATASERTTTDRERRFVAHRHFAPALARPGVLVPERTIPVVLFD